MTTCAILLPPANEVWGKVIFLVACVKNSVHGGSTWAGTPTQAGTPLAGTSPLWPGTPPSVASVKNSVHRGEYLGRYTHPGRYPLGRYNPVWPGTPPGQIHPQTNTPRQVHPTGAGMPNPHPHPPPSPGRSACWEIQATSGRDTSYWNAYLLVRNTYHYRSGTVNSNTVNSKFHLIRSYCEYLATILSFHV